MQTRPKKGEGQRFLECRSYESCLDFAALQNWKNFNCESCDFYISIFRKTNPQNKVKKVSATPEGKENIRMCEQCGEKPTIQPNSPLCASCIGKRAWKDKDRSKPKKRKSITKNKARPEESQQRGNTALTIEFGKHASILREIERLAEEEIRSVDEQVIYILKNYLSNTQAARSN